MGLKLSAPITKTFVLDEIDKKYGNEDPTVVVIRQATTGENEKRNAIFDTLTREWNSDTNTTKTMQTISWTSLFRLEVYLTLAGCNITDQNGKSLFRFKEQNGISKLDMSEDEFNEAWSLLPVDVSRAIHEKVYEVNIDWSPFLE